MFDSLPHSPQQQILWMVRDPIFPAKDCRAGETTAFPSGIQDKLVTEIILMVSLDTEIGLKI